MADNINIGEGNDITMKDNIVTGKIVINGVEIEKKYEQCSSCKYKNYYPYPCNLCLEGSKYKC